MWLLHSGATLYYCSVEEQEREAGLTRNDYFSLWQAGDYDTFADVATGNATPAVNFYLSALSDGEPQRPQWLLPPMGLVPARSATLAAIAAAPSTQPPRSSDLERSSALGDHKLSEPAAHVALGRIDGLPVSRSPRICSVAIRAG
jgi:hypothetical protein